MCFWNKVDWICLYRYGEDRRSMSICHHLVVVRGYYRVRLKLLLPLLSAQSTSGECPGCCNISRDRFPLVADSSQRRSERKPAGLQGHLLGQPAWWRWGTFCSDKCSTVLRTGIWKPWNREQNIRAIRSAKELTCLNHWHDRCHII